MGPDRIEIIELNSGFWVGQVKTLPKAMEKIREHCQVVKKNPSFKLPGEKFVLKVDRKTLKFEDATKVLGAVCWGNGWRQGTTCFIPHHLLE